MNLASKRRDKTSKVAPRLVVLKHTLAADFKILSKPPMLSFKTLLGYSISAYKKYFLDASCKFRLNSKDEILI